MGNIPANGRKTCARAAAGRLAAQPAAFVMAVSRKVLPSVLQLRVVIPTSRRDCCLSLPFTTDDRFGASGHEPGIVWEPQDVVQGNFM